jgi:hypothetical protein
MEANNKQSNYTSSQSGVPLKDVTETESHFQMRKKVYVGAVAAGKTHDEAVVLCSIFKNVYFMGCSYPESALLESKKFWPKEALDNPLHASLDD